MPTDPAATEPRPAQDQPSEATGRNWTTFNLSWAQRLYLGGLSCQQIADLTGYSRGYVSARLRRAGTAMRPTGRPRDTHEIDTAALVRLRRVGATWAELATILHVSRYAVQTAYLRAVEGIDR